MSELRHVTGKICKLDRNDRTPDEIAKSILDGRDINVPVEGAALYLTNLLYTEYFLYKNELYYIVEITEHDPYDSIFEGSFDADFSINFVVRFDDGGCDLNEALAEVIRKVEKRGAV